jgi:hypothetical protein
VLREGDPLPAIERFTSPPLTGGRGFVDLTLDSRPIVEIRGRLVQNDGTTPWSLGQWAASIDDQYVDQIATREDGSFSFTLRLPKNVGNAATLRLVEPWSLVKGEFTFEALAANETGRVDLGDRIIERRVSAAGVVRDAAGEPLPGLRIARVVRLAGGGDPSFVGDRAVSHALTDEHGRFELIGPPPSTDAWFAVSRDGSDYLCDPVPYREAHDIEIVVAPTPTIAGQIIADEGFPLDRVRVALWDESKGRAPGRGMMGWEVVSVDASGRFRSDHLAPGRYTVGIGVSMIDNDPLLLENIGVQLGAPQDPRIEIVDLRGRFGVLDIDVRDPEGNAVPASAIARYADRSSCELGETARPLILRKDKELATLTIFAAGFASAELSQVEAKARVVLTRDLPVELEWVSDVPLPTAPFSLHANLQIVPRDDGQQVRGTQSTADPTFGEERVVGLRVPKAGSYFLSVYVRRVAYDEQFKGNVARSEYVTDPLDGPILTVAPSATGAPQRIPVMLPAGALQKAIDQLNAK